tara:strand:+ start:163 stop:276 length:114 start_codon:yes stop_codon:yes gene_type:complete
MYFTLFTIINFFNVRYLQVTIILKEEEEEEEEDMPMI